MGIDEPWVSSATGVVSPTSAPSTPAAPELPHGVESIDGWKKHSGTQGGFTEGSYQTDPSGQKWYVKFHSSGEDGAKAEALALQLYAAAGQNVPEMKVISQGGKFGTASKVIDGLEQKKGYLQSGGAHEIFDGFAADAWLANWDTVGNNPAAGKGWDNMQFSGGKVYRIDAGGALHFKATGKKKSEKEWGDNVIELGTLLDPAINANTAAAFKKITKADIKASVAKVLAIPDSKIKELVKKHGPGSSMERLKLANKLIARKASLAAMHPDVLAKVGEKMARDATSWVKLAPGEKIIHAVEKHGVQFAKVEVPAKGFSPAGIPKPYIYDKSSSKHVNAQNTADLQKIYDTALSGAGPDAVKNLVFEAIDKTSGVKSGAVYGIDDHPSKMYVKEYFNQVLGELSAQLLPTYRMEQNGSVAGSYSAIAAEIADRVQTLDYAKFKTWSKKAADYIVLDEKEGESFPQLEGGHFKNVEPTDPEMVAFKSESDANYAKLSASEKSACKAYTGSAYIAWNSAMRMGEIHSDAFKKSAPMREAFDKAAVELPEGIILHRGVNVGGDTYNSIIGAVIQDGSFQSCSYGKKAAFSGKSSQLRIHVSKGVKGVMATTFSHFGTGERELILAPNTRYIVTKVEKVGGQNVVDVIALPHEV